MPRIILIVEDSEACAETLQIALETLPEMETRAVRGVHAALKLMADTDNEIVAIVTDLNMPRRDGFDLLGQIRADERHRRLPIVMVSGDSDPRLPERALASGASAFFSKPYSPLALRRTLEKLL
jgi:CheY-like chemotaxis protein